MVPRPRLRECRATTGHLIPDYERALKIGWKGIHEEDPGELRALCRAREEGPKGAQLRAMMTAATMPRDLAARYAALCHAARADRKRTLRGRKSCSQMAEEPEPGAVGAGPDLLGGGPGPVAHPHARHERRELPGAGRLLRPDRPVPASPTGRRPSSRAWTGNSARRS